jgi:hypothetical protein
MDDDGPLAPATTRGLSLVFPAFDGHIYIVEGKTGCTNKIDLGEQSYSMVRESNG